MKPQEAEATRPPGRFDREQSKGRRSVDPRTSGFSAMTLSEQRDRERQSAVGAAAAASTGRFSPRSCKGGGDPGLPPAQTWALVRSKQCGHHRPCCSARSSRNMGAWLG